MKKIKRILGLLMMCCMLLSSGVFSEKVYAATVGQQLKQPESGWKRYDERDTNITYIGQWKEYAMSSGLYYKDTTTKTNVADASILFNFTGTRLRLIGLVSANVETPFTDNAKIQIDGETYSFSQKAVVGVPGALNFETTGLTDKEHYVKITFVGDQFLLDAIDVDDTGDIINSFAVKNVNLDKTSINLNVNQSETVTAYVYPTDATNKTVTWTSLDPTIATVDSKGIVTGLKVGTTTIIATTQDGNKTATCIVTVSEVNRSNALLTIYLSNQTQRQYDLSSSELNAFLNWYDTRATGTGSVRYGFNKPVASSAFTKRTEYVVYDNIVAFDIDEYTSTAK